MNNSLKNTTVYVVGDSTVSAFADDYYLPRYGYGTQLFRYLLPQARVVNLALSGRSSKSFLSEENYKTLINGLSEGDFLVVGFGHNDEKGEDARYTNPNLGYDDESLQRGPSFRNILYRYYIKPALKAGAVPVLCTPVVRLSESGDYSGSCGHITGSNGKYEGGNYAEAVRSLGRRTGVTVIDLTAATMADYMSLGFARASDYHAFAATSRGERAGLDLTHLNKYGAKKVAYEWAVLLRRSDCPLKNYLRPELSPPDAADFADAVNKNYKEPQYTPFNPEERVSSVFKLEPPWYGTAAGDFGGVEHVGEFTVRQGGTGFTVGNDSVVLRGKISRATDGFAAAFMQIPADKNFTASATAEILSLNGNDGQSAFGMMLRDDVLIDSYDSALSSNYIAAGVVGQRALFLREGGALSVGENAVKVQKGAKYALSVTKINQQIRAAVDGFSRTVFDFDLVSVDNKFCYLCLFANRGIVVGFTSVNVTVTGDCAQA